jgi:predicted transcriptional regulator
MARTRRFNRGSIEIMGDILRLSAEGITITRIVYGANLSHMQASRYIRELQAADLIEQSAGKKQYKMTAKGRRFLVAYENMKQMLDGSRVLSVRELYSTSSG